MTAAYDSDFTDRLLFGERTCVTCHVTKPRNAEQFDRDATSDDGLHHECKPCRRERQKGRTDGARHAARQKERYATDPAFREMKKAAAKKTAARKAGTC